MQSARNGSIAPMDPMSLRKHSRTAWPIPYGGPVSTVAST